MWRSMPEPRIEGRGKFPPAATFAGLANPVREPVAYQPGASRPTTCSSTLECRRSTTCECGKRSTTPSTEIAWTTFEAARSSSGRAARCCRRTSTATGPTVRTRSVRAPAGGMRALTSRRARRLVAASGTRGQSVTVVGIHRDLPGTRWRLRGLAPEEPGLQSSLREHRTETSTTPRSRIRGGGSRRGSAAGYRTTHPRPTSSPGSSPVARARTTRSSAAGASTREIARALSLQTTDPGAASRLWSKVDHDVVDKAPWLFLQNPLTLVLVSRRVGNYQHNPQWGALLDQLWVR